MNLSTAMDDVTFLRRELLHLIEGKHASEIIKNGTHPAPLPEI